MGLFVIAAVAVGPPLCAAAAASSALCPPDSSLSRSDREAKTLDIQKAPRGDAGSGFLDPKFLYDEVHPNPVFVSATGLVAPDSLRSYIQHLEDYGTRHSLSKQVKEAGHWLRDRLIGFGYEDVALDSVRIGDAEGDPIRDNVIATVEGRTKPEYRIIIGGHYDSINFRYYNSATAPAPGADDNASGTSGILEIARILRQFDLDATVQYVFFVGEEQELYGSADFTDELVSQGVEADKVFYINMDMIANTEGRPWGVYIYHLNFGHAMALCMSHICEAYTEMEPWIGLSKGSDHESFDERGYPNVFVFEEDFARRIHTRADVLGYLDMDYATEVTRFVLATVLHLASLAPPPEDPAARDMDGGGILAKWNRSADADVVGYYVEVLDDNGALLNRVFTRQDSLLLSADTVGDGTRLRVRSADVLGEGDPSRAIPIGPRGYFACLPTPNPSRGAVHFDVLIPGSGEDVPVCFRIFDSAGRLVKSLCDGPMSRGTHTLDWNGAFANGDAAPSGVYFYTVEAEGLGRRRGKLVVLR